jgi:ATP-dependent DNA helicase RecG
VLFVGVENKGASKNIAVTDQLLLTLADLKSNGNILPPPTMSVEKRILKGSEIAVVIAWPADALPFDSKVAFGFAQGLVAELLRRTMNESSMKNAATATVTLRHIRFRHARWQI